MVKIGMAIYFFVLFRVWQPAAEIQVKIFHPVRYLHELTIEAESTTVGTFSADGHDVDRPEKMIRLVLKNGQIHIPGFDLFYRNLIFPENVYVLKTKGIEKKVRGKMTIQVGRTGLGLVVAMSLDDYGCGVMWGEAEGFADPNLLQVLAIVIRSYALYFCQHPLSPSYQVVDSTKNAFFKGFPAPALYEQAWKQTRDRVLSKNGRILPAYFFMASGGPTLLPEILWGGLKIPGFKSVPPRETIKSQVAHLALDTFLKSISKKLKTPLKDLVADQEERLVFSIRRGENVSLAKTAVYRIFNALDRHLILSPYFNLTVAGEKVKIVSRGNGHQVGLSLKGAYQLSRRGWEPEQILHYYYDLD